MTFLLRYDGVPEFRASPGLDSIPPRLFLLVGSLVCGQFGT